MAARASRGEEARPRHVGDVQDTVEASAAFAQSGFGAIASACRAFTRTGALVARCSVGTADSAVARAGSVAAKVERLPLTTVVGVTIVHRPVATASVPVAAAGFAVRTITSGALTRLDRDLVRVGTHLSIAFAVADISLAEAETGAVVHAGAVSCSTGTAAVAVAGFTLLSGAAGRTFAGADASACALHVLFLDFAVTFTRRAVIAFAVQRAQTSALASSIAEALLVAESARILALVIAKAEPISMGPRAAVGRIVHASICSAVLVARGIRRAVAAGAVGPLGARDLQLLPLAAAPGNIASALRLMLRARVRRHVAGEKLECRVGV